MGSRLRLFLLASTLSRPLHEVADAKVEQVDVERLGDILIRTILKTFLLVLGGKTCRQHHKRDIGGARCLLHQSAEVITIHHRHHHVTEDDVWQVALLQLIPSFLTIHGLLHDVVLRQDFSHELSEVIAIIYQQDTESPRRSHTLLGKVALSSGRCANHGCITCLVHFRLLEGWFCIGISLLQRNIDCKDGATARVVFHGCRTSMQVGKRLHEVESDATATKWLHLGTIHLEEAVEDMRLVLIADSLAGISHLDAKHILGNALDLHFLHYVETHRHTTTIWGKLVGIAQQIVDNLAHLINIERHDKLLEGGSEHQLYLVVAQHLEGAADVLHERYHLYLRQEQLATVLLYLSEVEYLVDEIEKAFGVTMDERQLALFVLIVFPLDHADQRRDNQGQWCTKLMAHIGKEVELQFIQLPIFLDVSLHSLTFEQHLLSVERTLAVEIDSPTSQEDIHHQCPNGEIERRIDINFQLTDVVTHRTIAIHHLHLQGVRTRREIGKRYLRTTRGCHHPLVGDSLHAIEEAVARRHGDIARRQLDGEGIVLIAQVELSARLQGTLQYDPTFILLACHQRMVEEHETTEECLHVAIGIALHLGVDDIDTILTADGKVAIWGEISRTIVELMFLQAIHRVITGHVQLPLVLIVLGELHVGDDKLRDEPYGLLLVFHDCTSHGSLRTIQFVDDLQLSIVRVVHRHAGRGCHPTDATAIHDYIVDGRTWEGHAALGRVLVGQREVVDIQDTHVLRVSDEHIATREIAERTDIVGWNLRVVEVEGLDKSFGLRVENLHTASQGSDEKSMVLILAKSPHTLVSQTIRRSLEALPFTIAIACHTSIEGTKVHRAIAHRDAAHHDIGTQARLCHAIVDAESGLRIIAYDTGIIGTTPVVAQLILRDGANIT